MIYALSTIRKVIYVHFIQYIFRLDTTGRECPDKQKAYNEKRIFNIII